MSQRCDSLWWWPERGVGGVWEAAGGGSRGVHERCEKGRDGASEGLGKDVGGGWETAGRGRQRFLGGGGGETGGGVVQVGPGDLNRMWAAPWLQAWTTEEVRGSSLLSTMCTAC